jgi:Fic family protein
MFYLSEYLESNRDEYYDRLLDVTNNNDWQGWIEFFLAGIIKQANNNTEKAKRIKLLYETLKTAFREATHSEFSTAALDTFFQKPIINSTDFFKRSGITTAATANTILRKLYEDGYLHLNRQGTGRAPSVYSLPELLNTAEGREVFPVKTRVLK